LRFRGDMQREGGLSAGLGAVDFGDAAARDAANAEGDIQIESPVGITSTVC